MHSHDADRVTSVASAGDDPRTAAQLRLLDGEEKGKLTVGSRVGGGDAWPRRRTAKARVRRFGRTGGAPVVDATRTSATFTGGAGRRRSWTTGG
jgi:hypothetical protein